MSWRIEWDRTALKEMGKLDKVVKQRIWDALDALLKKPEAADIKKLTGKKGEWRLKVGKWRVRFRPDFANKVYVITHVGPRRDVYRK
ncbi:MAG: type II toxin-antitoxin system RelE/ParE family toxin [Bacillota bacterium]